MHWRELQDELAKVGLKNWTLTYGFFHLASFGGVWILNLQGTLQREPHI